MSSRMSEWCRSVKVGSVTANCPTLEVGMNKEANALCHIEDIVKITVSKK